MNLKNKNIAEGMRVSNGKYELRVVSWDKSYTDCLLNYLDSKGNRYVIAWDYELSGTEKDPQISWMNGRYFTAYSDDEAFEEYLDYLGEVNEYDISESLKESVDYEVFAVFPTKNGFIVNTDIKDYQYIQIVNDKITKHSAWREDWFANAKKRAGFKDFDEDDMEERLLARYEKTVRKIIDVLGINKLNESLTESAKPINEKNVAKFVDELNTWVDDNVHYKDLESAQFTKKYGKLYDFKYGWDYSYGDKGLLKVWDDEGTLDWFEESYVKDFIVNLAKKYGWYCEAVTDDSDFTFDEL